MYIPDYFIIIASSSAVQAFKEMIPLLILALYGLVLEIVLNQFDRTFSQCWWFFISTIILILSDLIWANWAASTPMADIIIYAESASQLIASISVFLFVACILFFWMTIAGTRQIVLEAAGSGWGWALLRLSPIVPLLWLAVIVVIKGNALVGTSGFLNLIKM